MAYILDIDVTDVLANQFHNDFSKYHALTDEQLVNLGEQLGVQDTSLFALDTNGCIKSTTIKRYLVYWFCAQLFLDKMGLNNVSLAETEKYAVKYSLYSKLVDKTEDNITKQMLTGTVYNIADRSQFNNTLYRS